MALTTLGEVKAQGNINPLDTSRDTQIKSLINGITDLVKQTLRRDIESTQYTEYYSGDNSSVLLLNQYPIISVSRVCLDDNAYFGQESGAFPASGDLVQGTDYAIMSGTKGVGSSGMLRRINQVWYRYPTVAPGKVALQTSAPPGNILVTYTAGFSPVPFGIKFAVNAS